MIQLSLYDLLKLFNSCILCDLIITACMFVLKMSGMQRRCDGDVIELAKEVITTKVAKQRKNFRDGKATKTSLTMLFLIPTASKTCNSPKTYLKLLRSPMLTFPSSSHKDPLTLKLNEHLWPTNLAPTSLYHLSFHNTMKKGARIIVKMLQAMGACPTRCLSG